MGVLKDFSQEAYDEIKECIKSNDEWAVIDFFSDIVNYENLDYDNYYPELKQYAEKYVEQNNITQSELDTIFLSVNAQDEVCEKRFQDEKVEFESFYNGIKALAGLIDKKSLNGENITTLSTAEFQDKVQGNMNAVREQLISYYANSYYTVCENETIIFDWSAIQYAMRKDLNQLSEEELIALSTVFFQLYSEDEETNLANIEEMLRAGYGKVDMEDWSLENYTTLDWEHICHSVGLTDTFIAAFSLYNEEVNAVDYQTIMTDRCSEDEERKKLSRYFQNQFAMSSLFATFIKNNATINVPYGEEHNNYVLHCDEVNGTLKSVYVCLKDIPIDISYISLGNYKDGSYAYDVTVESGRTNDGTYMGEKDINKFQVYGMVDYSNISKVFDWSTTETFSCWFESEKDEVCSNEEIFKNKGEGIAWDKIKGNAIEYIGGNLAKATPIINLGCELLGDWYDNRQAEAHNATIDARIAQGWEQNEYKSELMDLANKCCINMQVTCQNGEFYLERYSINEGDSYNGLTKNLEDYNAGVSKNFKLTIGDIEAYLNGSTEKENLIEKYLSNFNPN